MMQPAAIVSSLRPSFASRTPVPLGTLHASKVQGPEIRILRAEFFEGQI